MVDFNILIPGRHHLETTYLWDYLIKVIQQDLCTLLGVDGKPLNFPKGVKANNLIFAITSANHNGTRRNPLDLSKRSVIVDRFGEDIKATVASNFIPFSLQNFQYPIDNISHMEKFPDYIIKKIEVESQNRFDLSPEHTLVLSSTPELIEQFQALGYQILPSELKPGTLENPEYLAERPWELVEYLVSLEKQGIDWQQDPKVLEKIHKGTRGLYQTYDLVPTIRNLFEDELLGADGDLTSTRDYRVYIKSFDDGAERKFQQIKDSIKPGRIVDIGCCTGSLIEEMSKDMDYQDSDMYGIEVARILFDECIKRKEQGYFKNDNVFFLQKNIVENQSFKENSIDTFTSFSLTHEVYSYQSLEALKKMINLLVKQLKPGGRRINVDVIGPENGERIILANFSKTDGAKEKYPEPSQQLREKDYEHYKEELKNYLESLSTHERFLRFAQDFRKEEGGQISYQLVERDNDIYIQAPYKAICEYLSKKEYTLNRESEMHEKFCDFAYSDWEKMLGEN
ncbi:MAG: methyltransferase domain-containing protein [Candidatus Peribacteria bacterium]|jgi:ubiquinone/menaquinone biosynthesis C-methylase UbiE|nr:methyltransferase domain-containing protein [Candidatus Peribacteria bacterium]